MLTSNPSYKLYTGAALAHSGILILCFCVLRYFGIIDTSFFEMGSQWDAGWYLSIINRGYYYHPDSQSNVAFYPLFPYLWKLSGLGPLGISVVNWLVALTAIFVVIKELKFPLAQVMLFWSFPCAVFLMVPYSESLFVLGGSLIILGLHQKSFVLVLVGTAIACFTRSIGFILALCFLFTYVINLHRRLTYSEHLKSLITIVTPLIMGGLVQWHQFTQAGTQFNYLNVQAQWGRELSLPGLPFTTKLVPSSAWTDYLAFFVGLCAGFYVIKIAINRINNHARIVSPHILFSLLYLAGVTCVIALFSPKNSGSTVIASLNRLIFATPFFLVFLNNGLNDINISTFNRRVILILIIAILEWGLLTLGANGMVLHYKWQVYLLLTLSLPFFYLLALQSKEKYLWLALYLTSTIFQAYFLGLFLARSWIG